MASHGRMTIFLCVCVPSPYAKQHRLEYSRAFSGLSRKFDLRDSRVRFG